jgi:hypothetical protein
MNCPNCGAENEADARFCAECGASLEDQADQPVAEDDDRTILASRSEISDEAQTVAVSQEDVANLAAEEVEEAEEAEFETEAPPAPSGSPAGESVDRGNNTQRYIIIAVVVLLVLCCCCCLLAIVIGAASGEIDIDDFTFMRDLAPNLLAFV